MISELLGKTTVQAVISFALTAVGCYLAVAGTIPGEAFLVQLATVIGFYFGRNGTGGSE